jgi:hypothetical protein
MTRKISNSLDDATLAEIAKHADIHADARDYFFDAVRELISAGVVLNVKNLQQFSSDEVAAPLDAIRRAALSLGDQLNRANAHDGQPAAVAGGFLRAALRDHGLAIKDVIAVLKTLPPAAEHAAREARAIRREVGPPRGTKNNVGFDIFAHQLRQDVTACGGKLTINKGAYPGGWGGTGLLVMNLLRPHLPPGFVPTQSLGKVLYRIWHTPL